MRNLPLPGEIYTHYKGGTYKIICLSVHTESQEKLVIYKSLNFGSIHARPLEIFMDDVSNDITGNIKRNRFLLTYHASVDFEF